LATKARPWEYIGWTYNPATLKLTRTLARLGLPPPNAAKLHNHLAGSWIWSDPSLTLTLADRSGQYYVYEVTPR
jgi:CubicO group peptidase (beta-lactamase class C family)